MNETDPLLNIDLICRTCLTESNELVSIFMDEGGDITKMLELCSGLNIKPLDGFPSNICSNCFNKVRLSYKFRVQCTDSHEKWLKVLNNNINLETENGRSMIRKKNGFEIHKCEKCPNQYTMLVLLQEHCSKEHPDEICKTELNLHNDVCEVLELNKAMDADDLIMDCNEEKYETESLNLNESRRSVHGDKENLINIDHHENECQTGNENDQNIAIDLVIPDAVGKKPLTDMEHHENECSSGNENDQIIASHLVGEGTAEEVQCGSRVLRAHRRKRYNHSVDEETAEEDQSGSRVLRAQRRKHCETDRNDKLDKQFMCDYCPKTFAVISSLRRHMLPAHGINLLKANNSTEFCEICRRKFKSVKDLHIHKACSHPPNDEWKCIYCKKTFKLKRELKEHKKTHLKEYPFTCAIFECGARFAASSELTHHMHYHTREKAVKCNLCDKQLISAKSLNIHQRMVHLVDKPHKCTECGFEFFRSDFLQRHMVRRHGAVRAFECSKCNKTFALESDLQIHSLLHARQMKKCDICRDSFLHLEKHKRMVHGDRSRSKCNLCGNKFLHIAKHKRIVHGIDPIAVEKFSKWFLVKLRYSRP